MLALMSQPHPSLASIVTKTSWSVLTCSPFAVKITRLPLLHRQASLWRGGQPGTAPCSGSGSSFVSCSAIRVPISEDSNLAADLMTFRTFPGLQAAAEKFTPPPGAKFSYGTAGFRMHASLLESTVFRIGVLAALRSLCTRKATGLVITASHNPIFDNGVKLVDPSGGMLAMEWEDYAEKLANCINTDSFLQVIEEIVNKEAILVHHAKGGKVLLARDTRPTGLELLAVARKGVEALGGIVAEEKGILTTPQLHWMVRAHNMGLEDAEEDYYRTLSCAFRSLMELRPSGVTQIDPVLEVDGANGVGASKLRQLQKKIPNLELNIRNTGEDGVETLNLYVGADYVQKEKVLPQNFDGLKDQQRRCVSIDGDGDRLVYMYFGCKPGEGSPRLHLLDGDKVMALFATFIQEQLHILACVPPAADKRVTGEAVRPMLPGFGPVTVGTVQTAYANGASTKYLQEGLGTKVSQTRTGVKHLHEKAATHDIGIYFEANGHGTILLKEHFLKWLKTAGDTENLTGEQKSAIQRLLAVSEMVNQAIGDALSGILMVELVLRYKGWNIQDWDSIYTDIPSRQLKVAVADRSIITTTAAETKVASPAALQEAIDLQRAKFKDGRAFVRPSGTEDVVRVYAEAETQEAADVLAMRVRALVHEHAGGIGSPPSLCVL